MFTLRDIGGYHCCHVVHIQFVIANYLGRGR